MIDVECLSDPVLGMNKTQVYVSVHSPEDSVVDAIRYLRNPGVAGARLKRVHRERGSTVVFEVVGRPGVRVGRSVPSSDEKRDIAEIQRVLGAACVLEN